MNCGIKQKHFFYILGLWVVIHATAVYVHSEETFTEEKSNGNEISSEPDEAAPSSSGEGFMYMGFRLVDLDDSGRAGEYEEDGASFLLGLDGIFYPLPHRYHMHADYFSEHNYYGDIGYAYRDTLLFRNILVGVHHNLEHYHYLYPGDPPAITYEEQNPGDENFVDFMKNEFRLRLKTPDYPFHTFLQHRFVQRDGALEERYLKGHFGSLVKTSQTRDIQWESSDLDLGINSHVGPLEVEFVHRLGDFDPGDNNVLHDYFTSFGGQGDIYPHNVIPETESSGNSVKFHTSYTGQIVASASLSNSEVVNNYSHAEAEIWKAAFDLRWIPDPTISLFFKYRHSDQDKENPEEVTLRGMTTEFNYPVRQLISTRKDVVSLSARYRPVSKLTLFGDYKFEQRERSGIEGWHLLPETTTVNGISLKAHARPINTLKLKAMYDYKNYENPSYNTEPDDANKLRLTATYTPANWLTAYFDYSLSVTQRDDLLYHNSIPHLDLSGGERDGSTNHFFSSLSWIVSPEISLTAGWAYNRWKVEQDLAYAQWGAAGTGGSLPFYDRSVPYTDTSNTFILSLVYMIRKDLSFGADLSYTISEGEYMPGGVIEDDPSSLASFAVMETTETVIAVEVAKKLRKAWQVSLKLSADLYNDKFSDGTADHQDGELFIAAMWLKRSF